MSLVGLDSRCREQIDCIDKGARSVRRQYRSSTRLTSPS